MRAQSKRYRGDVDRRKVCVIGAGPSGLITTKELLDENHQVVCYERRPGLGGVFNIERDEDRGDVNMAYDSTLLTVSNYAMAFSCFPPPNQQERRFWTVKEYYRYLQAFADYYHLRDYTVFGAHVERIQRWKQRMWLVQTRIGDRVRREVFDAIAVCGGAFQTPKYPKLPFAARENSDIEVLHAIDYRDPERFFGKRVLCIGMGESGADIVHEVATVADATMLSVRPSPPPLVPRYDAEHLGAYPNDSETTEHRYRVFRNQYRSTFNQTRTSRAWQKVRARLRHSSEFDIHLTPGADKYAKTEQFIAGWNRRSYAGGLPFLSRFLNKNTVFVEDVVEGRLGVNFSEIARIDGRRVKFHDGKTFEADTIVCCTGYTERQNPLFEQDDELARHLGGVLDPRKWYKHMIPPAFGKQLVFIGFARPTQGMLPACSELQARYFALLCSNRRRLPEDLEARTVEENRAEERMIQGDASIKTLVQYPYYSDDMAALIGCRPSRRTLLKDPALAYKLYFGSKLPLRYRLDGPHARPEMAKRVIKALSVAETAKGHVQLGVLASRRLYELAARARVLIEEFERRRSGSERHQQADPGFQAWGVEQLRPTSAEASGSAPEQPRLLETVLRLVRSGPDMAEDQDQDQEDNQGRNEQSTRTKASSG